jgi:sugar/nucleoside kinase (ribokinase family)
MNPSKKKIAGTLKTLSIGGATYDLFVQIGNDIIDVDTKKKILTLPIGAKIRVQDIVETCGGGACNTSVGLSRLGLAASFCGIVGSDQWGQRMLDNLQKEHVHTESATILEHETSSFSVILNVTSGDRIILYSTGTNAHLHDVTFDREAAAKHDWIYFNHIHEKSCVIQDDILHILQKHHAGMTWTPGGRQLKAGIDDPMNAALLKHCDLLLLNKEEAYAFTKKNDCEWCNSQPAQGWCRHCLCF